MRRILQKRIYDAIIFSDLLEVLNCVLKCVSIRGMLHTGQWQEILIPIKDGDLKKNTHTQIVCFNQSFVLHVYHIGFYIILFKSLPPQKMLCLLICICIILFRQYFA